MKPRPELPPAPCLVLGLARSGVAAALALHARGVGVIAADSGAPEIGALAGIDAHLRTDAVKLVAAAGSIVKSPGVPADAPAVLAGRRRGLAVIGELELAWRMLPNEFIAITGTNGKTTTTEWIGHIHRVAGVSVEVAGNVGTAASTLVGSADPGSVVVCECSSFQLEDTIDFAPEAAVLLNLSADHLDRHGTFAAYAAAKLRVFANQSDEDIAVYPQGFVTDEPRGHGRRVTFGDDGPAVDPARLALPGAHNVANARAAAAVCLARGLAPDAVAEGLETFAGVPHRLERVAQRDGVAYVNDSKATNVASTLVALASFKPGTVNLILGGQGKDQDFAPLRDAIARAARRVFLIGEDAREIESALAGLQTPVMRCGNLERAFEQAARLARSGEVVLLSPACASLDQFADFEARGDCFRALADTCGR